jgi:lysine-specific demethylase/histidyl-hydroxylase NO66
MPKAEPWLEDPLGYLIGPAQVSTFFAASYERDPLIAAHRDARRFHGLLSVDDVDRIVTNMDLREGQLDLADASRQMTRSEYVDGAGYIDRGAVARRYRGGATIILQQAHQFEPALARFCRGLEHVFSCHVQTNIYLTPPNAQGFRTHFDNHDVFVIQIEGEKLWRLYDKPVDTPYRGEQFVSEKHAPGEKRCEFTLHAGDCVYVPRGMMHDAITSGDSPSLHITVGLITRTWAELMLEAVSEVALRTPELRRSLPPGYHRADFDRAAAQTHLTKLAEIVAREVRLDPALDLSLDNFIRSRAADNRFTLREATRPLLPNDQFKLRAHAPFRLAEDGERLALIVSGGELVFTPDQRGGVERAISGAAFSISELGDQGEDIAARLLAYGLITRAPISLS